MSRKFSVIASQGLSLCAWAAAWLAGDPGPAPAPAAASPAPPPVPAMAVYVTNEASGNMTVIDGTTQTAVATIRSASDRAASR